MDLLPLQTSRLFLRNYQTEDWERVHLYSAIPEFSQYELWGPNTVEDTKNFVSSMVEQANVKDRSKFDFAVCLKESGLLIGGCGIRRETQQSVVANLGWAINPDFQKQGCATEAAQALISFGFEQLGLSVIYATCDTRNVASYRVMEKLGMKRVGFIKGDKEMKGHVRDSYRYELTRDSSDCYL
jgi:RimJ/RimL family protein N-acetyltransferase